MPGDDTGSHWGSCPHQGLVMLAKALIGYRHFTVVQFCFHKKKKSPKHTENVNSHLSLDALGPGVETLQENMVVTRSQHPPSPTGGRALQRLMENCVYVSDPHQVTLYRVKIGDKFYYIKIA